MTDTPMPSFSDTVAAVREAEQAIVGVTQAYQRATESLADAPEPIRSEAIREIVRLARQWADAHGFKSNALSVTFREPKPPPSATRAILDLLGAQDGGLTSDEIQAALRGRFQTHAENPHRVITSTLSGLRANGHLIRDEAGRYVVAEKRADRKDREELPLRDRMAQFFRDRRNKPATTVDLAKALGTSTNAIRATFSGNRGMFAPVEGTAPNEFKLWRLIEPTEGERPNLFS